MTFRWLTTALILLFLTLFIGCNGGEGPVSPDDNPVASFIHTAMNGYIPSESVIFDASQSSGGLSKIVSYMWDWGDGSDAETYTVPVTAHTFGEVRSYEVTLTIQTQLGKTVKASEEIEIATAGGGPVAVFSYDDPDGWNPGSVFYFDGSESFDPDGDIVSYYWEFGDGGIFGPSDSPTAEYFYTGEGEFEVTLTVEDGMGLEGVSEGLELSIGRPVSPEIIWSSSEVQAADIIVEGSFAYLLHGHLGLKILDISNPEEPVLVGQAPLFGDGTDFALRDGYLYVTEADFGIFGYVEGFLVFDVSDPSKPTLVKRFFIGNTYCLDIAGGYAYVGGYFVTNQKIHVFKIDGDQTEYAGSSNIDVGHIDCIKTVGNSVYYGWDDQYSGPTRQEIFVLDISDPSLPIYMGSFPTGGHPQEFIEHNNLLHVLVHNEDDGAFYEVYDPATNPVSPTLLSSTLLDNEYAEVRDIDLSGDFLYVSNWNSDLRIYSMDEFTSPDFITFVDLPRKTISAEVSGNLAFVGTESFNGTNQILSVLRLW